MEDRIFEEIREVFSDNFKENFQLINQTNSISAEFEYNQMLNGFI